MSRCSLQLRQYHFARSLVCPALWRLGYQSCVLDRIDTLDVIDTITNQKTVTIGPTNWISSTDRHMIHFHLVTIIDTISNSIRTTVTNLVDHVSTNTVTILIMHMAMASVIIIILIRMADTKVIHIQNFNPFRHKLQFGFSHHFRLQLRRKFGIAFQWAVSISRNTVAKSVRTTATKHL